MDRATSSAAPMLDPRIYRAALLPVAARVRRRGFSLEDRPRAAHDDARARRVRRATRAFADAATALADAFPDAPAGRAGDEPRSPRASRSELLRRGLPRAPTARTEARRSTASSDADDRHRRARRALGARHRRRRAPRRRRPPGAARAVGHRGAARARAGRSAGATLRSARSSLVSTSGGSGGNAGARRARASDLGGPIDAVLVLGDLAGDRLRRPLVVAVVERPRRRAAASCGARSRARCGSRTGRARAGRARSRSSRGCAFPLTRASRARSWRAASRGAAVGQRRARPRRRARRHAPGGMAAFGRAALRTHHRARRGDRGRDAAPRGRARDVASKVLPGWAVRLLVGRAALPRLFAAVDGLARVRRRRQPAGLWLAWVLAAALPVAGAPWLFALVLASHRLMPTPPPGPVPAGGRPLDAAGARRRWAPWRWLWPLGWLASVRWSCACGACAAIPARRGAAAALRRWCSSRTVARGVGAQPYAAALLVPAAALWLLVTAPEVRMRRGAALAVVALTLLPGAVLALYFVVALGYGPLEPGVGRCCCSRSAERPGSRPSWSGACCSAAWCSVVSVDPLAGPVRRRGAAGGQADDQRAADVRGPGLARRHRVGPAAVDGGVEDLAHASGAARAVDRAHRRGRAAARRRRADAGLAGAGLGGLREAPAGRARGPAQRRSRT